MAWATSVQALKDLSRPTNVPLLDEVVAAMHAVDLPLGMVSSEVRAETHARRQVAQALLMEFSELDDAWTRADVILEHSSSSATRFFALSLLEKAIRSRWRRMTQPQREGVRTYVIQKVLLLASNEEMSRREAALLAKLNSLLVDVLKHEWPANWPTFVPELIAASRSSELLCENNVNILRVLSEEVVEFAKGRITVRRAALLKNALGEAVPAIFDLFVFVLSVATRESLLNATLRAVQAYISWIPNSFVFESRLLDLCYNKFLPNAAFRVNALSLLTEVASIVKPEVDGKFQQLYIGVIAQLVRIIPPDADVKRIYADAEAGDDTTLAFMRNLAMFLCSYFKVHLNVVESEPFRPLLSSGMNYLVAMSDVNDQEIFKICVEYWLRLATDIYAEECTFYPPGAMAGPEGPLQLQMGMIGVPGGAAHLATGVPPRSSPRKALYAETLARVREIMINHMAKPEEVLIEEDPNTREIIRSTSKNTDALELYKIMRDTLVYLTHLDPRNTEEIMIEKLTRQMDESQFNRDSLNTLCWAIGSISGAISEGDEKRFLVSVIKDLLTLCERKRGKDNKAVVASGIMYVVGQYPRFLRAHWKFLKTVVTKLFEFMHERHPGVQDMAVDTYLKIAQKCKRKFVQLQAEERMIYVEELCSLLPRTISDLQAHQVHGFYEASGHMVAAHTDPTAREILTERLMALPNAMWSKNMAAAAANIAVLQDVETLREIQRVLRTNVYACRSIGASFAKQLGKLYLDMLNVYKTVSELVSAEVAARGPAVAGAPVVRAMISVKKEVLCLVSTYVTRAEDLRLVAQHFVPPLLELVLADYSAAAPAARDVEVLVLMTEIVNKLPADVAPEVPRILAALLQPTLTMLSTNHTDFPEHRINFFKLVDAVTTHCFAATFMLPVELQKLFIDSIVYAIKHVAPDIEEIGGSILCTLLQNLATVGVDAAQGFFSAYLLSILHEILIVLTDGRHKSQFKLHATMLRHLCHLVEGGAVVTPLWDSQFAISTGVTARYRAKLEAATAANGGALPPGLLTNQQFVREYMRIVVSSSFQTVGSASLERFVAGLFNTAMDLKAYKSHLRDFLIEVLEFAGDDTGEAALYAEETALAAQAEHDAELRRRMQVPGLANPYETLADDDDL